MTSWSLLKWRKIRKIPRIRQRQIARIRSRRQIPLPPMAAGDGWSASAVLSSISSWTAPCFPLEWCYSHSSSILASPRLRPPGLGPSCSAWVWFSVRLENVYITGFVAVYVFNLMSFVKSTCNIKVWYLWNPCHRVWNYFFCSQMWHTRTNILRISLL